MSATAVYEEQVQISRERLAWARQEGITLAQLLARAHEDVQACATADCPLCGGIMERAGVQATCASCGSRLS
jgi:hypothetical protein